MRHKTVRTVLAVLLFLAVTAAISALPHSLRAQGAPIGRTERDSQSWPDPVPIPYQDRTFPPQAQPDSQLVTWSTVAFETVRFDATQWEIATAKDDGTGVVRVTDNPAYDIHPRLNRGCTRIAFASKRSGNYDIFVANADGTGVMQLTTDSHDDVMPSWSPDGTRIAFQSYRDGQAEIYVMNADGSNQGRMTIAGGYDGEPAWSPDGSRIAFSADRTGQYVIWLMNVDGSGQVPLSTQDYSENPAWKPDGSQIAYDADADHDGWQELWLMNADGSGQHQVYDAGSFGLVNLWARSWSPEGRYIAFTFMYFDCAGPYCFPVAGYLSAWDTSGQTVRWLIHTGYDENPDWQTTDAEPPVTSVTALPDPSPSPIALSWSGSDGGGSGFLSYDLQARQGPDGAWADWLVATAQTSASYAGIGGQIYAFRCRGRDRANNVEAWPADYDAASQIESLPPITSVGPLPAYLRSGALVPWGGTDPGDSGIVSYTVEYREAGAADWIPWLDTSDTSARFVGEPGTAYCFRCRAVDAAQNLEGWPSRSGDACTTLYRWGIAGTVADNCGAPIGGMAVGTQPGAQFTLPSSPSGAYASYVTAEASQYTALWPSGAHGALPDTTFDAGGDAAVDLFLPPADDVVVDGGLESGGLAPRWLPGGLYAPEATGEVRHTGAYSAWLGARPAGFGTPLELESSLYDDIVRTGLAVDEGGAAHVIWTRKVGSQSEIYYARRDGDGTWSAPVRVSVTAGLSVEPVIEMDAAGAAHMLWRDYNTGESDIYYARRAADGSWSPVENLSDNPAASSRPHLVVGPDGAVHAAWSDAVAGGCDLYYARRSPSGGWSVPARISSQDKIYCYSSDYTLVADGQGIVHLAWHWLTDDVWQVYYARRSSDGSWSTPLDISNPGVTSSHPRLAVDGTGTAHVLWTESTASAAQNQESNHETWYSHRQADGTWTAPQNLSNTTAHTDDPYITVDNQNVLHVLWTDQVTGVQELYYLQRAADGAWSSPVLISTDDLIPSTPRLALDPSGAVHAAWSGWWNVQEAIMYARRDATGAWSMPEMLSPDWLESYFPRLATDRNGGAHLVWATRRLSVYYVGPAPLSESGDSSISQAVAIPPAPSNPVLSFMYRLGGASSVAQTELRVEVDDGTATYRLLTINQNTDAWKHAWAPLDEWAGQTVTLIFGVHEAADAVAAWATIDEVSVGSSHPDLWVSKQASAGAVLPGEILTFTLTYGNQGCVAASDTVLTDTLPAGLTLLSADPPPATIEPFLTWSVGELPAASGPLHVVLTAAVSDQAPIGTTLSNALAIGSATPEVELLNNEAQARVWIGWWVFLPHVARER